MSFVSQDDTAGIGKRKLRFTDIDAMLRNVCRFLHCVPLEFHVGQ